jgi:hypothetical protein
MVAPMMTLSRFLILPSFLVAFLGSCSTPPLEKQQQMQAEATFPQAEARRLALTKVPDGRVKSAELEREHGVLIWSFDITMPHSKNITEVAVDAHTGKIVGVEIETPEQQAKEAAEDRKG